jgi:putative AlgH/UPF0301 family transcriptional regulator
MSLQRVCFFITLAAVVFVAATQSASPQFYECAVSDPNIWPHGLSLNGERPPSSFLPVQFKNAKSLAAGKLLVASRDLADPHFTQTVILLVRYDAQGVLGLILNRHTDVPLSRVLKDFAGAKGRSDTAYLGGPVETPAVLALLKSPAKVEGAERIFDSVYLISEKPVFDQAMLAKPDPSIFHVYLGYAGWNEDQLRMEVELGAWFVFPEDANTVFNSDPESLWPQMIRKTELQLAASRPLD